MGNDYQKPKNSGAGDLFYWIMALCFLAWFPPIGIIMLVTRLFSGNKKDKKGNRGRHPYYVQQEARYEAPAGARTVNTSVPSAPPVQKDARAPLQKRIPNKGKGLILGGGITMGVFLFALTMAFGDAAYYLFDGDVRFFLLEVMDLWPLVCFSAGGAGMLWVGLRQRKKAKRFRRYLGMIGTRKTISLSSIASGMGCSIEQVQEDLEDMLEDGIFPAGYLDYGRGQLVLTLDGIPEEEPAPKRAEPKPKESPAQQENAVLAEIRAVNDDIDNPKLSAQIDRIGVITAKIFDYQKSHPEKSPQLHSFLSYYLPTTLKILRAYAQLEDQEVSGENISSAMKRIEDMMEKVVEGFEKQLDQLFQGDVLDITTDVEVLERMMAKDGLASSPSGFTLEL